MFPSFRWYIASNGKLHISVTGISCLQRFVNLYLSPSSFCFRSFYSDAFIVAGRGADAREPLGGDRRRRRRQRRVYGRVVARVSRHFRSRDDAGISFHGSLDQHFQRVMIQDFVVPPSWFVNSDQIRPKQGGDLIGGRDLK